jgi:hypothetical protein
MRKNMEMIEKIFKLMNQGARLFSHEHRLNFVSLLSINLFLLNAHVGRRSDRCRGVAGKLLRSSSIF